MQRGKCVNGSGPVILEQAAGRQAGDEEVEIRQNQAGAVWHVQQCAEAGGSTGI